MDWSVVLVAAIAAAAPLFAVVAAWNQQRAAMHRVEDNTNGQLLALREEISALQRAAKMRVTTTSSAPRGPSRRTFGPLSVDEPTGTRDTGIEPDAGHRES